MTGPEHYREAERLLALAGTTGGVQDRQIVAEAQAHATLAVAAAQIETAFATSYPGQGIRNDWVEAVGS